MRHFRRGAFTAIELLVAISIIVVLVAMVGFGLRAVLESSKDKSTRQTLMNLKGLLAELELKGGVSRPAPAMWRANTAIGGGSFWTDGDPTDNVVPPIPAVPPEPDFAFTTPASVKGGEPDRTGSDAIANTEIAMQILQSIPLNKKAIGQMPSNQLGKNPTPKNPQGAGTFFPTGVPPLFLDAWGNPIIFVPAGGLRVTFASRNNAAAVVTSAGVYDPTNAATPNPPMGIRPFFASAGPDGDFTKGDDNVYSFEQ